MPPAPAAVADSFDEHTPSCLLLNAAGVTLRRLREVAGEAGVPPVAVLPGPLAFTPGERQRVLALRSTGFVERESAEVRRRGLAVLHPFRAAYPPLLRQIPDPPLCLYAEGDAARLSDPAVAVVGSRNATMYGRSAAEAVAGQLALAGLTVTSGFARGIDAAAHHGAARGGGATVAVLGCGADVPYPRGHEGLRAEIRAHGCVVTEFPLGTRPTKTSFPQRNRIISGLSLGTVVIEARDRSGALITARHALEQGREVFAVPGSIFAPSSAGPHRLIKDGAKLVEHVDDILAEIQAQLPPPGEGFRPASPALLPAGSVEARVFGALGKEPLHVDELAARLGLAMPALMPALSLLELRRCARAHPGKFFSRP